ncbi:MAG: hypothetical protein NTZ55_04520 [Candidatus Roizmanbacteria bacterium]|nr:hypothetical protein [Candidatus Roizmanbacteria bacterium]
MAEKHLKSKEIDITKILVAVLFVMLGALFILLTNNLSKNSSSTATRATDADNQLCTGFAPLNMGSGSNKYNSSVDYCPTQKFGLTTPLNSQTVAGKCGAGYTKDTTTRCGKMQVWGCCRSTQNLTSAALGGSRCNSLYGTTDATCKKSCDKTEKALTGKIEKCGYIDGTDFKKGVCCSSAGVALLTTACPHADGMVYNCAASFSRSSDVGGQTNGNVGGLTPVCIPVSATVGKCGYKTTSATTTCNGLQWMNGILMNGGALSSGCYVGVINETPASLGNGEVACSLIRKGVGYTDESCKQGHFLYSCLHP